VASITGLTVLVVDDDDDTRDLLEMFLTGEGAAVRSADSAENARTRLGEGGVDVILTDASLPDEDGFAFVARLREEPATARIPAIAITGYTDARAREQAREAGFQKFITKPFDVFALPAAIASVVAASQQAPHSTFEEEIPRLIEGRDMRTLLGLLNEPTPYRYTSILRFDGDRLESVWTLDRQDESADTFRLDVPVDASYCGLVRDAGAPFVVADALEDPRVQTHPKRSTLRSYCGVPIYRPDGSMFGTLCHYDRDPHPVEEATVAAMKRIADLLSPVLPVAGRAAVATS
jgi:CheY-like chemotaxis protein